MSYSSTILKVPPSICFKAGFVVLNSLSFCFYVKLFFNPLNTNESLSG